MDIQNFTTPYTKDSTKSKNTKFTEIICCSDQPVIIGFDMSVVIIKVICVSPTTIATYHILRRSIQIKAVIATIKS